MRTPRITFHATKTAPMLKGGTTYQIGIASGSEAQGPGGAGAYLTIDRSDPRKLDRTCNLTPQVQRAIMGRIMDKGFPDVLWWAKLP